MEILEIPTSRITDYESISISFEVQTIFEIETPENGLGGMRFIEKPVSPYLKDYDALGPPHSWLGEFDTTNWGFFLATESETPLAAAAVAWNTNGVDMLEGRRDMSVLWDIRVSPNWRGKGLGKALLAYAADWSRQRGCTLLKIETQNVNVNACRFYASQGCVLGDIRRFAYREVPAVADEIQLNWYLAL